MMIVIFSTIAAVAILLFGALLQYFIDRYGKKKD